jgi:hypothetical protein
MNSSEKFQTHHGRAIVTQHQLTSEQQPVPQDITQIHPFEKAGLQPDLFLLTSLFIAGFSGIIISMGLCELTRMIDAYRNQPIDQIEFYMVLIKDDIFTFVIPIGYEFVYRSIQTYGEYYNKTVDFDEDLVGEATRIIGRNGRQIEDSNQHHPIDESCDFRWNNHEYRVQRYYKRQGNIYIIVIYKRK